MRSLELANVLRRGAHQALALARLFESAGVPRFAIAHRATFRDLLQSARAAIREARTR